MVKLEFYLLVLLISYHYTTSNAATNATAMNYVNASCRNTRYPALCVRCLQRYANSIQGNDQKLAKAAISVSLNNAKSTAAYISKLSESSGIKPSVYQAVNDCLNNMNNCVPSLNQSVQELGKMAQFRGQNFEWHMSNVETWVSSALTNQNTCARGFSDGSMDGPVKDAVIRRMNYLSQLTSNALALINRFALKHKAGTHMP
ncbi:putative pectinesterase [Helianthus annuus]|uniref:Pectinesterase n=1 Tax=Helianthus annuus TaxID=4232 RepID=A0A251VAB3_HELAN|nr:21 kDa protein [Helianthus annuus]KAF5816208.1 putative pectinesterase [Helianthus annuus]KAJ0769625.1 putative pectinesterase [Helianthus annuus]